MIQWKDKVFSGQILRDDDEVLTAVVYTVESFQDVSTSMTGVTEIYEFTSESDRAEHKVTGPRSAKIVAANTYFVEFSTKQPLTKQLENKIQEQSDAIDDLLVMMLEG